MKARRRSPAGPAGRRTPSAPGSVVVFEWTARGMVILFVRVRPGRSALANRQAGSWGKEPRVACSDRHLRERGSGAPFHRAPSKPQAMDNRVRSVAARSFRFEKLWRTVGLAPLRRDEEVAAARELFQFFADPREHPSNRMAVRSTPPLRPSRPEILSRSKTCCLTRVSLGL
jgi:hypothetical protein